MFEPSYPIDLISKVSEILLEQEMMSDYPMSEIASKVGKLFDSFIIWGAINREELLNQVGGREDLLKGLFEKKKFKIDIVAQDGH